LWIFFHLRPEKGNSVNKAGYVFIPLFAALLCNAVEAETLHYRTLPDATVQARVERFAGKNEQRRDTLKKMFEEAGCKDENLKDEPVKGSKLPNLICVLQGSSEETIIVGAHFDRAERGDGVIDNWSGASLLPSLYESLKADPRGHTFIFVAFTDEERGLVGSRFFTKQMTGEAVAATKAMVNMDTLGLGPTKVWASGSDKNLVRALTYIADKMKSPLAITNMEGVGTSDNASFSARKIPNITIHSFTQKALDEHILHSAKDNLSQVRLDDYYQTYCLTAAYLCFLDIYLSPKTEVGSN
jgi:putative aminopeptidase FrvX